MERNVKFWIGRRIQNDTKLKSTPCFRSKTQLKSKKLASAAQQPLHKSPCDWQEHRMYKISPWTFVKNTIWLKRVVTASNCYTFLTKLINYCSAKVNFLGRSPTTYSSTTLEVNIKAGSSKTPCVQRRSACLPPTLWAARSRIVRTCVIRGHNDPRFSWLSEQCDFKQFKIFEGT